MTRASGIGSWPGSSVREALRIVRDLLAADHLPYLPELPARGPGADLIGRTAGLLVELPVDLQPSGWRLVDRPGRDAARTAALWREDLDELAEAFDGHDGSFKVQVAGPVTLAASLWLPRGERSLVDPGALRDVTDSLAAGIAEHLARVRAAVPGAALVAQIDEPSLPTVLAGRLPTQSGFGKLPALPAPDAAQALRTVLHAARAAGAATVVHCCADEVPFPVLRLAEPDGIALDTGILGPRGWESLAVAVESETTLYAGAVPTRGEWTDAGLAGDLARRWQQVGLPVADLDRLVVTPSCGLAGATPADALARQRAAVEVARRLSDRAAG